MRSLLSLDHKGGGGACIFGLHLAEYVVPRDSGRVKKTVTHAWLL